LLDRTHRQADCAVIISMIYQDAGLLLRCACQNHLGHTKQTSVAGCCKFAWHCM